MENTEKPSNQNIELQPVNNNPGKSKEITFKEEPNINSNNKTSIFKKNIKSKMSLYLSDINIKDKNDDENSAGRNQKRFREEKEKRERDEINNRIQQSKEKNLKSIMKKITSITEVIVKKRIKIVDFIIAFFVLINLIMQLASNNQYTSKIVELQCSANDTNSTDVPIVINNATNTTARRSYSLFNFLEEDENDFTSHLQNYIPKNKLPNPNKRKLQSSSESQNSTEPNTHSNSNPLVDPNDPTANAKADPDEEPIVEVECPEIVIKEEYENDDTVTGLRWLIVALIFINECLLLYRYYLKLKLMRTSFLACSSDNFFTTGIWKAYLFEMLIQGILSPPGLVGTFEGRMLSGAFIYSYDSIITFFVLFKLYYFIRIYANISIWASERVMLIGIDNKISIGPHFAMKAQIKKNPYLSMIIMLSVCIGIFGFMMRIFEYGYTSDPGAAVGVKAVKNPNFKTYTDTFWVIIITMMTVGYGDIFPNTHLGRVIAFLSALCGMLIVSLLIVSLSYVVEFSPEEKKAHNLIKKNDAHQEMQKLSATMVKSVMKLMLMKKSDYYYNQRNNSRGRLYIFMEKLMYVKEFSIQFNRFQKIASTNSIPTDEILSQLERKLTKDADALGPQKFLLKDITAMTNRIVENEQHINNAVNFLKEKEDELSAYLIKFNAIKSGHADFNSVNKNDFLITE